MKDSFVSALSHGTPPLLALAAAPIPASVRTFVESTLTLAMTGEVEEVAASFLLGREDLVPAMFRRLLPVLAESHETAALRLYLERHIDVDEQARGPMARRLLCDLCGGSQQRWQRAEVAARNALIARLRLWDGVLHVLSAHRSPEACARALST